MEKKSITGSDRAGERFPTISGYTHAGRRMETSEKAARMRPVVARLTITNANGRDELIRLY